MGQPIQGLTPDRSRIRPKSRPARRRHPCSRALGAGAPPRLGKGHPSSAARRSDPPLTELAPLSPRGRGADDPHPSFRKGGVTLECPRLVASRPSMTPPPTARLRRNRPFVERAKTDGAPPAEIPRIAISLRSILPSRATFASEHERRPDSGWANSGGFFGSSIAISARRSATARPIVGSFFSSSKAPVINLTVATEATDQCDTRIDRAPA